MTIIESIMVVSGHAAPDADEVWSEKMYAMYSEIHITAVQSGHWTMTKRL